MTTYTVQAGSRILVSGVSAEEAAQLLCVPTTQLEQLCASQGCCTKVLPTLAVWTAVPDKSLCDDRSSFSCTGRCLTTQQPEMQNLPGTPAHVLEMSIARHGSYDSAIERAAQQYGWPDILGIHPSAFDKIIRTASGYGHDGNYYDEAGKRVEDLDVWKDYRGS